MITGFSFMSELLVATPTICNRTPTNDHATRYAIKQYIC